MALRPVVFSGPSGTGKSTLLSLLFKEFPNTFGFSVSHTTRKPRPGEEDGKHYHFTTIDDMQQEIEQGKFIEHAKFSGNLYGTSLKAVQDVLDMKTICLLDIDEQGVKSIKKTEINPLYVFVAPPSLKILRSRLESRGTETAETIEKRMATAISAMEYSKEPGVYDVTIVNDKLDQAYQELRCFLLKQYPSLTSQEVATSTENDDGPSSTAVSEEAKNEDDTKTNVTTEQSTSVKDSNKEMSKTDVVLPLAEPSMETTMSNNESITDISLSPVKLRVDPDDDIPAIMKVDATIDVSGNGVVTSENQNSSVIVTRQSSVINMEPEPANESSAVCGDATWGSCLIL